MASQGPWKYEYKVRFDASRPPIRRVVARKLMELLHGITQKGFRRAGDLQAAYRRPDYLPLCLPLRYLSALNLY